MQTTEKLGFFVGFDNYLKSKILYLQSIFLGGMKFF